MMSVARIGAVAAVLLVGVACGTETGNPEELGLAYDARSSEPDAVGLRTPADAAEVDAVWLRLAEVTLQGDCTGDGSSRVLAGLGFADHADPAPVIQRTEVPFTELCGLETSFVTGPADPSEPASVAGSSVALEGVLADGRAFAVVLDEEVPVSLALPDVPLPETGGWLLGFDVATWLDPEALAALPDDPVRVDAATHPDLLAALRDRIPLGVGLYDDLDGDGALDPDEEPISRGR
jgi:hypothetical protein